jgi:hypothetical protein
MSNKSNEHLSKIKDHISNTEILSEDEKSEAFKKIELWELEDRASGTLYEELVELSSSIKPILAELGLI